MTKPENNLKACCVLADLGPYHAARFKATAGLGDLVVLDTGRISIRAMVRAVTMSSP